MLTRRPRIFSRRPRLEAVRPLPRLEATPPVTKTCLVRTGRGVSADVAKLAPVVSAGGRCPSVHGVSEYQERALLTCTDTGSASPVRPECPARTVRYRTSGSPARQRLSCRRPPRGGDVTASGAAISGLGMTSLGRVYGSSPRRLAASAVRLAAADAGMALADIDGLLICPGITGGLDVGLAGVLGLRDLALLAVVNSFGASAATAVQVAAQAVTSGTARAVACVFADTPLREGAPAGSAFGSHGGPGGVPERHGLAGLAAGYGFRSVTVHYALAARRHMERYGTTSEQLGAIAVAQRRWAAGNPAAQYRDPITLADHQRSRWVAEPLHLLDCSVVSNGAVAVIVTSAAAAAAGPRPAVHVWGWGQGHPGHPMASGSDFGLGTGAVQAGRAAMGMAEIGPADVTMGQIYDCYTYTVLVTLEDYGFCAKGEGGAFAASGALAPGGSLPVNTGGGQLSAYYMWGFTPLSEAIIQARGDGGARQSAAADVILVSGNGGILAHHGTLVVSPHPAGSRPGSGARGPAAGEPAAGEPVAAGGPAAGGPAAGGPAAGGPAAGGPTER